MSRRRTPPPNRRPGPQGKPAPGFAGAPTQSSQPYTAVAVQAPERRSIGRTLLFGGITALGGILAYRAYHAITGTKLDGTPIGASPTPNPATLSAMSMPPSPSLNAAFAMQGMMQHQQLETARQQLATERAQLLKEREALSAITQRASRKQNPAPEPEPDEDSYLDNFLDDMGED